MKRAREAYFAATSGASAGTMQASALSLYVEHRRPRFFAFAWKHSGYAGHGAASEGADGCRRRFCLRTRSTPARCEEDRTEARRRFLQRGAGQRITGVLSKRTSCKILEDLGGREEEVKQGCDKTSAR